MTSAFRSGASLAPAPSCQPGANPARPATYLIRLRDLTVPMSIGVYAHEEEGRQRVRISVEMEVEQPEGGIGDDIHRIPSYEGLVLGLRAMAEGEHVRLLETVAEHVLDLALAHPLVLRAVAGGGMRPALPAS